MTESYVVEKTNHADGSYSICGSTFRPASQGYVCPLEKRTKPLNEAAGSDYVTSRARTDERCGPKFV